MPPAAKFPANVVAYLQRRGIHPDVIRRCMDRGLLYESSYDGKPVCVFVSKDNDGAARFAHMRGIGSDVKRDVLGSNKRFAFSLSADKPTNTSLAVFEAPIDLLSHMTLALRGDLDFDGHRIALGGLSDIPLTAFLERNPHIQRVSLCLDADEAGQTAAGRICADRRFAHIAMTIEPPGIGKDYNDMLRHLILQVKHERDSIHREAIPSL